MKNEFRYLVRPASPAPGRSPASLTNISKIFLQLVAVLSTAPIRLVAYCIVTTSHAQNNINDITSHSKLNSISVPISYNFNQQKCCG